VNVKASQTISASSSPIQQVSTIHDLGSVSTKHHGDYVSEINMGIKQDYTSIMPSKLNQVGTFLPKDTIHGNISWSNTYVDDNTTIDPIMDAMTLTKVVLHILQQGPNEGAPSFETSG
jgi:hypothetical protein